MPELPEVESLAAFLRGHATGHTVARADAASFSVLKTFDPPLTDLSGQVITEVGRTAIGALRSAVARVPAGGGQDVVER